MPGSNLAMEENRRLCVWTDVWSEALARKLLRLWPNRTLDVYYLKRDGNNRQRDDARYPIRVFQLDPDVSSIWLPQGIKFDHALWKHVWDLTMLFRHTTLKESIWSRWIGWIYSSRLAEVLYLRNFHRTVEPWVLLCLYARYLCETGHNGKTRPIVFLSSNSFGTSVAHYLKTIYEDVDYSEPSFSELLLNPWRTILTGSVVLARDKVRGMVKTFRAPKRKRTSTKEQAKECANGKRSNHKRSVAVEAHLGLDFERSRSDLFWLPKSGIPNDQILVYFGRSQMPPSSTALAAVKSHGWESYVLDLPRDRPPAEKFGPYGVRCQWWRAFLMLLVAPVWLLAKPARSRMVQWCWQVASTSLGKSAFWYSSLFSDHEVRLHSNYSDCIGSQHMDQSLALEWQGGLNLQVLFSIDTPPPIARCASRSSPYDVWFVWGSYTARGCQDFDVSGITTFIACGYLFDYLFESARQKALVLRHELQEAGAQRIISFFDTGFGKVNCPATREDMEGIYQALLTEVTKNREFGLVLKPKNIWEEAKAAIPEELLKQALATGRCKLLVRHSYSEPPISPADAALASDLAVGCPISSAVIEAVLAGVPGVHVDVTRQPGHWFYEVDYEKFVFNDLDQAMETIRRWIRSPADEPKLGHHTQVLDGIDPFRDGKAAQRIGQYMAWLLEGFNQGLSRDDVVRQATHRYAEEYGAQYVRLAPRLCRVKPLCA
ncbi:MAG: hypothetical protein A3G87_06000 [Omnitrophica bacterium RIFCSPLOWO2_12_FULL_50_11]|nr:MAG: hypothetical protein A3G87_06000 [Omnitrophica bacterium RIFCSPLOWO2_12_FULL_50_11]